MGVGVGVAWLKLAGDGAGEMKAACSSVGCRCCSLALMPASRSQAMTGVKPDDTCASSFEALKSKKESRYIIYTITADGKNISKVASEAPAGSCEEDWGKFSALLTGEYAAKCCYAVFDFDWTADDGHDASKIMFVLWSPEGAKVKDKMMTTGSKDALKKALVGIGQDFQATDASEITYEECLTKAKSAVRPFQASRTTAQLAPLQLTCAGNAVDQRLRMLSRLARLRSCGYRLVWLNEMQCSGRWLHLPHTSRCGRWLWLSTVCSMNGSAVVDGYIYHIHHLYVACAEHQRAGHFGCRLRQYTGRVATAIPRSVASSTTTLLFRPRT